MSVLNIEDNILGAFRTAWQSVRKATSGARTDISVTVAGSVYRFERVSGSFVTDGFTQGDEVVGSGAANAANNGMAWVTYVSATKLQVTKFGTALVAESAGATITIVADMPTLQYYQNLPLAPDVGKPWVMETLMPGVAEGMSLKGPTARVRDKGNYSLILNYPAAAGDAGLKQLRGKIREQIYPASQLSYGGQIMRVQIFSPKTITQTAKFASAPLLWTYWTDSFNPN